MRTFIKFNILIGILFATGLTLVFKSYISGDRHKKSFSFSSNSNRNSTSQIPKTKYTATNTNMFLKKKIHQVRRSRRQINKVASRSEKQPICLSSNSTNSRPVLCYNCTGEARSKTSICDNTLWHFARKAEQYQFRVRCPNHIGTFCVKLVKEKKGIRETQRGCFGPGPMKIKNGENIQLKEGCLTYESEGYIVTTCLCKRDLCNNANCMKLGNIGANACTRFSTCEMKFHGSIGNTSSYIIVSYWT